jgi:Uma2 family endonuclease
MFMSVVSTTKMTARQYLMLGEDPPGVRLELVEGEVAVSPSPLPKHSHAIVQLTIILGIHLRQHPSGKLFTDVDTIVDEFNVRRPDLLFFSNEHLHLIGEKAMEGPPDLCVEVVSPSSRLIDKRDKFRQYANFGVPNYWIVDPEARTIVGYILRDGAYIQCGEGQGSDVVSLPPFPDLQIPLAELWL